MSFWDKLLGRKKEPEPEPILEPVADTVQLIPDETYEVIQQAIDAITNYIVREAQKKASAEGHPLVIYPENVLDVINNNEIKIKIERD